MDTGVPTRFTPEPAVEPAVPATAAPTAPAAAVAVDAPAPAPAAAPVSAATSAPVSAAAVAVHEPSAPVDDALAALDRGLGRHTHLDGRDEPVPAGAAPVTTGGLHDGTPRPRTHTEVEIA